jgi:hypothetical protein
MPAIHEQQLADLAFVLADPNGPAVAVVIAGRPLKAIRDIPALVPAESEGLQVERQTLYLLRSVLGFAPATGQELLVDGERWLVESCPPGDVVVLGLMRYRT